MVATKPAASPLRKGRRWMLSRRRCENCDVHLLVVEITLGASAAGGAAGWTTGGGGGLIGSLILYCFSMLVGSRRDTGEEYCGLFLIQRDAERQGNGPILISFV